MVNCASQRSVLYRVFKEIENGVWYKRSHYLPSMHPSKKKLKGNVLQNPKQYPRAKNLFEVSKRMNSVFERFFEINKNFCYKNCECKYFSKLFNKIQNTVLL